MACCCASTLQQGTKNVAITFAVLEIIRLVVVLKFLPGVTHILSILQYLSWDENPKGDLRLDLVMIIVLFVTDVLFSIIVLGLTFGLYIGAHRRHYPTCRIWLYIAAFVSLIRVVLSTLTGYFEGEILSGKLFATFLGTWLRVCMFTVVYDFIQELTKEKQQKTTTTDTMSMEEHQQQANTQ